MAEENKSQNGVPSFSPGQLPTDCGPSGFRGILFIGDPHVAASPPGHRLDDYFKTVMEKLGFCLGLACDSGYLPIILGDLFHVPRNNPNHLLVELIELFRDARPWVLVGNHDKYEARLTRDVSLSVLQAAGVIKLLDNPGPVASLTIRGARVLIGASPDWTPIPAEVDRCGHDFVFWLTHHDLHFSGYESARLGLKEIHGVDGVVNGHIHTPKPPQKVGSTIWHNPGSIVRITRSAHTRSLQPQVVVWTPEAGAQDFESIAVPHRPFDEVFPPLSDSCDDFSSERMDESFFIRGLENLALRRTTEGVGLKAFLEANLDPEDPMDRIIWDLYEEVMSNESEE